jgi:hypothetical protein
MAVVAAALFSRWISKRGPALEAGTDPHPTEGTRRRQETVVENHVAQMRARCLRDFTYRVTPGLRRLQTDAARARDQLARSAHPGAFERRLSAPGNRQECITAPLGPGPLRDKNEAPANNVLSGLSTDMADYAAAELKAVGRLARFLTKARTIQDVKYVRDKAEASWRFTKMARFDLSVQNHAAELMLRAERRAGELLAELLPHGGDRKSTARYGAGTLADLGIDPVRSSLWRREAAIPEAAFERYLARAKRLGKLITSKGLLGREARRAAQPKARKRRARR